MLTMQVVYQVYGATRSLAQRVAAGECSTETLTNDATYFPTAKQAHSESTNANLFDIYYGDTFKVVVSHMAKEQYILTQCGQNQPLDSEINLVRTKPATYTRKHFKVPLQTAIAGGTVFAGFLESLQVQDRITYVDSYSTATCWQKAMSCGGTFESSYGNATIKQQQMNAADAVFMDCSFGGGCSNVNNQPNAVHAAATQDPSPQKSAEYIKFFGAFFNKEPEAKTIYAAVETSYNLASTSSSNKPTVAWVQYNAPSQWGAESFVVSDAQYKLDLVTDAGGLNFNADSALANVPGLSVSGNSHTIPVSAFNNSKVNASSYFLAALATVDVIIDETYAPNPTTYTYATFKSNFGVPSSSSLPFVQQQKVLRIDGEMAASSKGLSWYESRVPRPDWAVEGLARYLVNDNSKRQKYFRNIATNEQVNAIDSTACSKTLPVCQSTAYAEVIPLLASVTTTTTNPTVGTAGTNPTVGTAGTNPTVETAGTVVAFPCVFIGIIFALLQLHSV
jgi:hypothetical protein